MESTALIEQRSEAEKRAGLPNRERPFMFVAAACFVFALVATIIAIILYMDRDDFPGDTSVDAGFARSMSDHHAQAVLMSGIVYQRTDDPVLRMLAYDILTTQQAQIGMMGGWLAVWGLSSSGTGSSLDWMGHTMDGPMPGMASDEDIERLRTLPIPEMNRLFLELMIVHHQGGAEMARAAADLATEAQVRRVAGFMADAQTGEIATMQQLLTER